MMDEDNISMPAGEKSPSAVDLAAAPEKWHSPRINTYRVAATYWSFILLGSNDSSYGVLIPQIERYYHVSYIQVALIFLSPAAGSVVSTLSNHALHLRVGQRGVAAIAGACHVAAYLTASFHPPFPAFVMVYVLVGFGGGAKQSAWNSYVGAMQDSNELLGILHGLYGAGAAFMPALASSLFARYGVEWFRLYYVLLGMAVVDLVVSTTAFASQTGRAYRARTGADDSRDEAAPGRDDAETSTSNVCGGGGGGGKSTDEKRPLSSRVSAAIRNFTVSSILDCLQNKVVLLSSGALLCYVGSEVAVGGWLVTFMMEERGAPEFESGLAATGFWAGITVGRFVLGFVTSRLFRTEKQAVAVYLALTIVTELLYWLIPSFVASAISVAFFGFFLGPMGPAIVLCIARLLPRNMHVTALGICAAVGTLGASIVPFMVGAIAQARGVAVLQPVVLAFLVVCLLLWLLLPRLPPYHPPLGEP